MLYGFGTNCMIKAIFFDLDGTLRHSVPTGGDVFTDFVRTLGFRITHEDRLRRHALGASLLGELDGPA